MTWKLDQTHAEFYTQGWKGTLDLANPENGITFVAPSGVELNGILGVSFSKPSLPSLQDCFIRQSDLIVSYPPRDTRKFHVQLDHRILAACSETLLIELWISVQTYLLDNHPIVHVCVPIKPQQLDIYQADSAGTISQDKARAASIATTVAKSNACSHSQNVAIVSGAVVDQKLAIALFNHPRDQLDTEWSCGSDENRIEAKLFGHFMEKGVIRRARMRCLISSKPFQQHQLEETYHAFLESPLPLTA